MDQIKKRYQCDSCSATFNDLQTFETHSRLHFQKSVMCSICNAVFSGVRSMKFHMWKAHEISKINLERNMTVMNWEAKSFPPCENKRKQAENKITSNENKFVHESNSNMNSTTGDDSNEEKIFKCYRCNKTFKYEFSIAKHLKYHLKKGQLNVHNNDIDDDDEEEEYDSGDRLENILHYNSDNSHNKNVPGDLSVNEQTFLGSLNMRSLDKQKINFPFKTPINKIILTSTLKSKLDSSKNQIDGGGNKNVTSTDDCPNPTNTSQTNNMSLNLSVDDLGLVRVENVLSQNKQKYKNHDSPPIKKIKLRNKNKVNFECLTCSATFEFDFCYFAHIKQHEVMNEC